MSEETYPVVTVMFRKWKACEDVIAIFPYIPHRDSSHPSEILVDAYSESNGHHGADFDFIIANTIPACEVIYRETKERLREDGYILEVIEEKFPALYHESLRQALLRRLGVKAKDFKSDEALLTALNNFLVTSEMPYEQIFFDWYGGAPSAARAAKSPELPRYNHESFAPFEAAITSYEPRDAKALDHAYFLGDRPCTMLIDEVEAIWSHIDERDDWQPVYDKVDDIREMGEALA